MKSSTRYHLGIIVLGCGLILSFVHPLRYTSLYADSLPAIVGSFIPPVLATVVAVPLLVFLHTRDIDTAHLWRGVKWYVAGVVLFGGAMYVSFRTNIDPSGFSSMTWFSWGNWVISGSVIGLAMANYDIRRTWAVHRARTNKQRADQASQRLSVLNRVFRHDVRNQTNVILGYTELLEDNATVDDEVAAIEDAAASLADIAERMRKVHGTIEDETPQPVDLTNRAVDVIERFQETHPHAQVTTGISDGVHAQTYSIIDIVLDELLENAIEHNPLPAADCQVAVTVDHDEAGGNGFVEIVIEDNGPGIPDRERVVSTDRSETQLEHSSGTGLWLTRWVVDESSGEFDIEDADPAGSRIRLRLPTADAP